MHNKSSFATFEHNVNKYKLDIKNYILPNLQKRKQKIVVDDNEESIHNINEEIPNVHLAKLYAFPQENIEDDPQLCTYLFMEKSELTNYLQLKSYSQMRKSIQNRIKIGFPPGTTNIVLTDLIYSVTKFCIKSKFTTEQSGAIIGMFYSAHRYFSGNFNKTPKEVYEYFVKFMIVHTFDFAPHNVKLFNLEECRKITIYFCNLYLRFLPLIRLVCLPNIALEIDYTLEAEPPKSKGKKDKGKKDKKKKKK